MLDAGGGDGSGDRDYETAAADGCASITGLLDIAYPSRTNIDGLAGLTSVGDLSIKSALVENVDGLANLEGLAALESFGGSLIIWWNGSLIDALEMKIED